MGGNGVLGGAGGGGKTSIMRGDDIIVMRTPFADLVLPICLII